MEPLAQSAEHLTFNQGVPRSSRGWLTRGRLAQRGERLPYKQDVGSSNLSSPTIRSCGVVVNMPACHAGDREFDSRQLRHIMRVWFNGRMSASQAEDVGSIPITRSNLDRKRSFFMCRKKAQMKTSGLKNKSLLTAV
jgi:hypothetical protein